MVSHAAARAARHTGYADSRGLLSRWRRQIATELWRRAARMIIACYPRRVKPEPVEEDDLEDALTDNQRPPGF